LLAPAGSRCHPRTDYVFTCTGWKPVPPKNRLRLYLHRLEAGATQEPTTSLLAPAGSRCHPRTDYVFTCTGWKPVPPKNRLRLYLHRLEAGATQEPSTSLLAPAGSRCHPRTVYVFTCTGWKPVPPKNRLRLYLHWLEAGATQEPTTSLLAPAGSRCHPRTVYVFTCTGWKPVPPKNRLRLYLHWLEAGATQEPSTDIASPRDFCFIQNTKADRLVSCFPSFVICLQLHPNPERVNEHLAKSGKVVHGPGGEKVAVADDRLVAINGSGGANVVADAGIAGDRPAIEDAGADQKLGAVADGGDPRVAVLHESSRHVDRFLALTQHFHG